MNEIPDELRLFRTQWLDAIERDFQRVATRSRILHRRSFRFAVPTLAVLAAASAAVMLVVGGGTQAQSADAAILRSTLAALTPPPGTILHEQAQVTTPGQPAEQFELWVQADTPHAYRAIKSGHEASWNGSTFSGYDAASNTIATAPSDSASLGSMAAQGDEPIDVAATLRSLVQSGQARVAGRTTINGTEAYKLTVTQSPDAFLIGTTYVAASDYHPLLIQTITDNETITYQTYDYLPATSSNLKLLDVAAEHPTATVITQSAPAEQRLLPNSQSRSPASPKPLSPTP